LLLGSGKLSVPGGVLAIELSPDSENLSCIHEGIRERVKARLTLRVPSKRDQGLLLS
jgi:hypothetical protein